MLYTTKCIFTLKTKEHNDVYAPILQFVVGLSLANHTSYLALESKKKRLFSFQIKIEAAVPAFFFIFFFCYCHLVGSPCFFLFCFFV